MVCQALFFIFLVACVSCVSATFFQPVRSGSHLYSAHRNTVRSRTLSTRSYRLSWVFPFGTALLPSLCFYYSTLGGVCQEVFEISFKGLFLLGVPYTLGVLWTPLDFSYIVPHIGRFVKGFFTFFFEPAGRSLTLRPTRNGGRVCTASPLDNNSISHLFSNCNRQNAQIRDFYFLVFCATFLLTKLVAVWYNKISRLTFVGARPRFKVLKCKSLMH